MTLMEKKLFTNKAVKLLNAFQSLFDYFGVQADNVALFTQPATFHMKR